MNKKVLLVTKIGKNFGALLQAFALKKVLESKNCIVNTLNYALPNTLRTYDVMPKVTGYASLKKWLTSLKRASATKKSVSKFLNFRENYFSFTKEYRNINELVENPPVADIYITGSDQVWNPLISFDPAYYLMFGDKNAIRASYAASIGVEKIPPQFEKEFIKRVKSIDYRSVRERSGQMLLESYGIDSKVTLDPTLLINSDVYDEIVESPSITKPYILLYFLIMPENAQEYIDNLRKIYPDHIFVSIPGNTWAKKIGDIEIADIGPREFIGLIKFADAVVTTSFHGTVFSLIYKKKFMSVLPNGTGGRISSILSQLGLEKQIAHEKSDVLNIDTDIDYNSVDKILNDLRKDSLEYLDEILENKD